MRSCRRPVFEYEKENNMKYKISRVTDYKGMKQPCKNAVCVRPYNEENLEPGKWEIEINSLDELQELIAEAGTSVIIGKSAIQIYDGYRE